MKGRKNHVANNYGVPENMIKKCFVKELKFNICNIRLEFFNLFKIR